MSTELENDFFDYGEEWYDLKSSLRVEWWENIDLFDLTEDFNEEFYSLSVKGDKYVGVCGLSTGVNVNGAV